MFSSILVRHKNKHSSNWIKFLSNSIFLFHFSDIKWSSLFRSHQLYIHSTVGCAAPTDQVITGEERTDSLLNYCSNVHPTVPSKNPYSPIVSISFFFLFSTWICHLKSHIFLKPTFFFSFCPSFRFFLYLLTFGSGVPVDTTKSWPVFPSQTHFRDN